jgi:hypothetical protein
VLDATFVKIETDAGITGWGEGMPWGHTYVPAHGPGIRAGIETIAQAILGLDPRQLNHVERAMDLSLPGHLYAKAPVDMACWDIAGQAAGWSIAYLIWKQFIFWVRPMRGFFIAIHQTGLVTMPWDLPALPFSTTFIIHRQKALPSRFL